VRGLGGQLFNFFSGEEYSNKFVGFRNRRCIIKLIWAIIDKLPVASCQLPVASCQMMKKLSGR
jgi:hypothetical protein